MSRPRKIRFVGFEPGVTYFKPRGIPLSALEEVKLSVDELEALRLADFESLDQPKAAEKMKISQSTLQRILSEARKKVAQALVSGQAIRIEGGDYQMARGLGGRGRMGGPYAAGSAGVCVCSNPDCKNEIPHRIGIPCTEMKCPKCGSPMIRKG